MISGNAAVAQALAACIPGLAEAVRGEQHATVLTLLRGYIYDKVNWGNDGLQLGRWFPQGITTADPRVVLKLLEARELSLLCGATAQLLASVYQAFGYDASPYNYGIREVSTHVTTLVALPVQEGAMLVLQDATFNLSMMFENDFDFPRLIQALASGRVDAVAACKGPSRPRPVFFNPRADYLDTLRYYKTHGVLLDKLRQGQSEITNSPYLYALADLDFDTSYRRRREPAVLEALARHAGAHGGPPHLLQLLLHVIDAPRFASPEANVAFSAAWPHLRQATMRKEQ